MSMPLLLNLDLGEEGKRLCDMNVVGEKGPIIDGEGVRGGG